MKVLIISSDQALVSALQTLFATDGWEAAAAADVRQTMRILYEQQPEAVVLDGGDPFAKTPWLIFARIREVCQIPILVYARGTTAEQRMAALAKGADDAVSATCMPAEIMLRVRNLVRHHVTAPLPRTYRSGDGHFTYDALTRSLTAGSKTIDLTPCESRLLVRFLCEPDRFLTTQELAAELWGDPQSEHLGVVKVYVHRLRNKLRRCSDREYIINQRAIGYRLLLPVHSAAGGQPG